jgi:hypothetical protein
MAALNPEKSSAKKKKKTGSGGSKSKARTPPGTVEGGKQPGTGKQKKTLPRPRPKNKGSVMLLNEQD